MMNFFQSWKYNFTKKRMSSSFSEFQTKWQPIYLEFLQRTKSTKKKKKKTDKDEHDGIITPTLYSQFSSFYFWYDKYYEKNTRPFSEIVKRISSHWKQLGPIEKTHWEQLFHLPCPSSSSPLSSVIPQSQETQYDTFISKWNHDVFVVHPFRSLWNQRLRHLGHAYETISPVTLHTWSQLSKENVTTTFCFQENEESETITKNNKKSSPLQDPLSISIKSTTVHEQEENDQEECETNETGSEHSSFLESLGSLEDEDPSSSSFLIMEKEEDEELKMDEDVQEMEKEDDDGDSLAGEDLDQAEDQDGEDGLDDLDELLERNDFF